MTRDRFEQLATSHGWPLNQRVRDWAWGDIPPVLHSLDQPDQEFIIEAFLFSKREMVEWMAKNLQP